MDGGLRQIFRRNLLDAQWTSVETGATAAGVPDSEYCFPHGLSGWVEFKKVSGWVVPLRPAQIGWLLRRSRMGGRCFVAAVRGETLYLEPGASAVELREVGLREADCWIGGEKRWDWDEIRSMLKA